MADQDRNRPLYMIGVAAELAGMHPQTLRSYEQKGLVTPQRTRGNTRMYSQADIERLEFYYILRGRGEYNDNGTLVELGPGDVSFTAPGEGHGILCVGDEPLEYIALILFE